MQNTFLTDKGMLTVMLQCETPETAIGRIRNANMLGADAYGPRWNPSSQSTKTRMSIRESLPRGRADPFM